MPTKNSEIDEYGPNRTSDDSLSLRMSVITELAPNANTTYQSPLLNIDFLNHWDCIEEVDHVDSVGLSPCDRHMIKQLVHHDMHVLKPPAPA